MQESTLNALDDVIEFCVAKYCKTNAYPDNIESLILSRLYHYGVKETKDYSWHVFVSEIHDTNQAAVKDLHSNHECLMNDSSNKLDPVTKITTLGQPNIHLKFYSKRVCQFKVKE